MAKSREWPRVGVVGAGAVGCYFGGLMARAGAEVIMIGRKSFVEAVKTSGLLMDTLHFRERIRVDASTELSAIREVDVILFCVKTTDNGMAARELASVMKTGAIVVSLQNGVDNVDQIRAAAQIEALPAAVYVAASVPEPGSVKHVARGDLVVGPGTEQTRELAEHFGAASIPCRVSDNIEGELWTKLLWNCALNAISAVGQARYGRIAENVDTRNLVEAVVNEVFAVAWAARIVLPGLEDAKAGMTGAMKIATQMSEALSSTAQDINRGKRTEIDSLNGFIARRGAELGVPTPMNQALSTLVKLVERR